MLFEVGGDEPMNESHLLYRRCKDYSSVPKTHEVKHGLCKAFLEHEAEFKTQKAFVEEHGLRESSLSRWLGIFNQKGSSPNVWFRGGRASTLVWQTQIQAPQRL